MRWDFQFVEAASHATTQPIAKINLNFILRLDFAANLM